MAFPIGEFGQYDAPASVTVKFSQYETPAILLILETCAARAAVDFAIGGSCCQIQPV